MRLTTGQKRVVYQLIALGTRPCEVERRFNEEFPPKDGSVLSHQQVSDYCKRFKDLGVEEQISYLPNNMRTSFALQEVRINDDIHDLQILNERLKLKDPETNVIEIIRAKMSIKNRIGQELGQVAAFAKGGVGGNLNILQMKINQFKVNLNKFENLSPQDRIDLMQRINVAEADAKAAK